MRRVAMMLGIAALLAPIPPVHAFNPLSCGFDSPHEPMPASVSSCDFRFTGTPIHIEAYAKGSVALAPQLRVWVSPGSNAEVAIVECSEDGRGFGATYIACDRDLTLFVADLALPDTPSSTHLTLTCHVEIVGIGGGYGCSSPEPT